jgi:hypothetical protein
MTLPYQSHSVTSQAAAKTFTSQAATCRDRVYQAIAASKHLGMTDEEVQIALTMNPSTQRPRRIELWDAGKIVDSGKQRPTTSGRMAVVWIT